MLRSILMGLESQVNNITILFLEWAESITCGQKKVA